MALSRLLQRARRVFLLKAGQWMHIERMKFFWYLIATALCLLIQAGGLAADSSYPSGKGVAEHVVVIVWDGMRPDFVRPQYTPTLARLAEEGVFFASHHP